MAELTKFIPEIKISPKSMEGKNILAYVIQHADHLLMYDTAQDSGYGLDDESDDPDDINSKLFFEKVKPYIQVDILDEHDYETSIELNSKYKNLEYFEDESGNKIFVFHNYGKLNFDEV